MLKSSTLAASLLLLVGLAGDVFRGPRLRPEPQTGCSGIVRCSGPAVGALEVTLRIRRPGHCQNLPTAQELFVKNTHPTRKMIGRVDVSDFLEPGHIPDAGGPPPELPITIGLFPGQQSEGLACTLVNDLRDINNPKLFSREFSIVVDFEQQQPPGGAAPTCSGRTPSLRTCRQPRNPTLAPGLYQIQSTNFHFTEPQTVQQRGNTRISRIINVPICINKTRNFQQLRCAFVPDQVFSFGPIENGCYVLKDHSASGNLVLANPGQDDQEIAELLGLGSTQIASCSSDQARFHWQLTRVSGNVFEIKDQATGKCLQINANHIEPEGEINAIRCRGTLAEQWTLIPLRRP
jgi:hypothetical protein